MECNSLTRCVPGLLTILFMLSALSGETKASPEIDFVGFTSGYVISTEFDPDWVVDWPSIGDKVKFNYNFACFSQSCDWPDNFMSTSVSVPSFSAEPYLTTSTTSNPEVFYNPETMEVAYTHPFDSAIPDDWFRFREGVEYEWWQEIFTVEGRLGGGWTGSVYYYYSVFDWENELFDNIEGKFTFVTEPVPEPATMVLFGSGLAGFIGVQLRKTSRRNQTENR